MLDIQKYYHDEYIVYEFIGSISNESDILNVKKMLSKDISQTYVFIFNFRSLNYINKTALQMLQELYILGVNNACEMLICGLHTQPAMMVEISQLDRLYTIKETLKDATNMYYGDDYDFAYSN